MKINFFALATTASLLMSLTQAASGKQLSKSELVQREEVLGYSSQIEAQHACISRAELYLKKFADVICEPVVKTNVRTLRWNSIVSDSVYSGMSVDVDQSSSSYHESGTDSFQGEILSFGSRVWASITSSFSSSGSSSSYHRHETPIYSTIHKSIPQYRDEVVQNYGYRIITNSEEAKLNTSTVNDITFRSERLYDQQEKATLDCQQYKTMMLGFRIVGQCEITQQDDGRISWNFTGKNYFQK